MNPGGEQVSNPQSEPTWGHVQYLYPLALLDPSRAPHFIR
jgi:hypothetical protein